MVRETILLVGYSGNLRVLYDLELREEGYRVIFAETHESALSMLRKGCPDLVVIDGEILLSEGTTLLQSVRTCCTRTLIILNEAHYDTCKQLLNAYSVDGCLVKSSDVDRLRAKIKDFLQEKRLP